MSPTQWAIDMRSAVINAGKKPENERPEINVDTNQSNNALITNMKSPNVIMVIGSEKKISIGRTKTFNIPKSIPTTIAI